MIDLTFISVWSGMIFIILFSCYLLIKVILNKELKKSLPEQIKMAQQLFTNKKVRISIVMDEKGKVELEHWELIKEPDYVG